MSAQIVRLPRRAKPRLEDPRTFPHDPSRRGYVIQYEGARTRCPGCGRSNWLVGRLMAECAFARCATALPIGDHHG